MKCCLYKWIFQWSLSGSHCSADCISSVQLWFVLGCTALSALVVFCFSPRVYWDDKLWYKFILSVSLTESCQVLLTKEQSVKTFPAGLYGALYGEISNIGDKTFLGSYLPPENSCRAFCVNNTCYFAIYAVVLLQNK